MRKRHLAALAFPCPKRGGLLMLILIVFSSTIMARPGKTNAESNTRKEKLLIDIAGTVRDEQGTPVQRASIKIKGTNIGTVSDENGNFSLQSTGSARVVLVVSNVGYDEIEVPVSDASPLAITLKVSEGRLDDVVVVGYNTQLRKNITGSVSSVTGKDLVTTPSASFAQQLQGRAPGVEVSNDNKPGGQVAIRIHGIGSITGGNDPLYVIDGVPTVGGTISLNPNDIENIQILKDAATASVYGARANNGVVIITTKKGKVGNTVVTLDAAYGVQTPRKDPLGYLTAQQYGDILWQSLINAGQVNSTSGNPVHPFFGDGPTAVPADYINPLGAMEGDPRVDPANYSNDPSAPGYGTSLFQITKTAKQGTDWYKALTHDAPSTNINLNVSGGSDKGRYSIGGGYYDQEGIMRFTGFKRYSFRANSELIVKKVVHIGENFQFSYNDEVNVPFPANGGVWQKFYHTPSFFPVLDIAGNDVGSRNGTLGIDGDPYVVLSRNKDNHGLTGRAFGNFFIQADIHRDFALRSSVGVDYSSGRSSAFNPFPYEDPIAQPQEATLNVSNVTILGLTWTNTLSYKKTFGDDHSLSALVGTEAIDFNTSSFSAGRTGFTFEDHDYRYLDAGNLITGATGSASAYSLFSLFAKADYAFRGKYLLSATIRRDGSSRFAPAERYGVFPAVGVGWILSDENFLKGIPAISYLKLRGSWGITGNQEIDPYNAYSNFVTSTHSSSYDINGTGNSIAPGFERSTIGNPEARWEEQKTIDIGFDASLFKNKLDITFDWYKRSVDGLLLVLPSLATDGQNTLAARNVGSMYNKGVDLGLTYHGNSTNGNWKYSIGVNWSTYTNKVTQLFGGEESFISGFGTYRLSSMSRTVVGRPIASFFGYEYEGIFQTAEQASNHATQGGNAEIFNQAGRMAFRNIPSKDGGLDSLISADDRTFIGNPLPDFTYGVNINVGYKNIDLTVLLQGVQGNTIFNYNKYYTNFMVNSYISPKMLDAWTPENTDATVPMLRQGTSAFESQPSSYYLEDGSYFRAKNVILGYTLPTKLVSRAGLDRLRIYVQAQNLFTITNYSGFDPEVNYYVYGNGGATDIGVDRGVYPSSKSYFIGLQVGF